MRVQSYLQSATEILEAYRGEMPLAAWLKNYFRQHKKFGSRDRKLVADLCFCYFRLGQAFTSQTIEEQLLIGQFLCHEQSVFVTELRPDWIGMTALPQAEKVQFLAALQSGSLFPFLREVSSEIDAEAFALSALQQPDLFLRIRPGKEKAVLTKLQKAGIAFSREGDCLRFSNSQKIDEVLQIDTEVVVQDKSSQQVLKPVLAEFPDRKRKAGAWDCCAASGGKSILLHDALPQVRITATDIRETILVNLRNRLKRAAVPLAASFVADVAATQFAFSQTFDIVLCDAPCSGSGTWGRTPEQLRFFPKEKIAYYAGLQQTIALHASRQVKKEGFFLYITCSVFEQENEGTVQFLKKNTGLQFLSAAYFKGYTQKADTLFAALFKA